MQPLVLASSSAYRRELLNRLHLPFTWCAPDINENHQPGERPENLVRRLAEEKARALAGQYPNHLIIGSDQVAVLGEQILGKPHDMRRAQTQLEAASGNSVTFLTGLCLLNSASNLLQTDCVTFTVHFRQLGHERIRRYLEIEQPFDCAGSFKAEGLGIVLFDAIHSADPTALVGLPLIATARLLRVAGFSVP